MKKLENFLCDMMDRSYYDTGNFPKRYDTGENPSPEDELDMQPWWGILPRVKGKSPFTFSYMMDTMNPNHHIVDNDKEYSIEMRLPGLNKNHLYITLQDNVLKIAYDKFVEENKPDTRFFAVQSFEETIPLSKECNLDTITSEYKDGILNVSVQKFQKVADEPKIKKIEIK